MSEESYELNLRRGVTGRRTPTCYPAALEQISEGEIHPAIYQDYQRLYDTFHNGETGDTMRDMTRRLLLQMGSASLKGFTKAEELSRKVSAARQEGRRIIAIIATNHAIGLKPVESERWLARSTWIPFDPDESLGPDDIFPYLDQPARRLEVGNRKLNEKWVNFHTLPPEAKRRRR